MDRESDQDAQARLERDYLAGSISADEYTRLRRQLHEGLSKPEDVSERERPPTSGGDPVTGLRLASWGRRGLAFLLDWLILIGVMVAVGVWALFVFFLAILVLPSVYQWLMVGRWGQTLGKMALGVRVVRAEDASRVAYARSAGRVASAWLLGIFTLPLLLAYLWPLWDRRNQTLYDKMVNTIVVRVESA